jgi:hypothetical protein
MRSSNGSLDANDPTAGATSVARDCAAGTESARRRIGTAVRQMSAASRGAWNRCLRRSVRIGRGALFHTPGRSEEWACAVYAGSTRLSPVVFGRHRRGAGCLDPCASSRRCATSRATHMQPGAAWRWLKAIGHGRFGCHRNPAYLANPWKRLPVRSPADSGLHPGGRRFDPVTAHQKQAATRRFSSPPPSSVPVWRMQKGGPARRGGPSTSFAASRNYAL